MDAFGFAGLAVSLVGHFLLARGNDLGWAFRVFGGCFWIAFACFMRSPPLMATSAVYMSLDIYGLARRRL